MTKRAGALRGWRPPQRRPEPTEDSERALADLAECGYCLHRKLLPEGAFADLRARLVEQADLEVEYGVALLGTRGRGLDTYVGAPRDDRPASWQGVTMLPNKGRPFVDLFMNPDVLSYAGRVLGRSRFLLSNQMGVVVREGAQEQGLHADQSFAYFGASHPLYVQTQLCLSEFTATMGSTLVVPGSHRLPPPQDPASRQVCVDPIAIECPENTLIIWDHRLWHGQGPSTSSHKRISILTYFTQVYMRPSCNYPASLHRSVYESLTDHERELLGFRMDIAGALEPQGPDGRWQNTNRRMPFVPELTRGGPARPTAFAHMRDMDAAEQMSSP